MDTNTLNTILIIIFFVLTTGLGYLLYKNR